MYNIACPWELKCTESFEGKFFVLLKKKGKFCLFQLPGEWEEEF